MQNTDLIFMGKFMKRICIFLFSGTGMTKYVIDHLAQALELLSLQVDVYPIEEVQLQQISFDDYDRLGIAYPVHAFNAPKIVVNFAKQLPDDLSKNVFLISTAGEDHPINYSSSQLLMKILRKKQCSVFYDKQLYMPSNFAIQYDEAKVAAILSTVDNAIPQITQEISSSMERKQSANALSTCMATLGRAEWFGAIWLGKLFYADKHCNHCGICAANCPNRNITNGNKVRFRWHCGLCMRCLYICPQRAIKIRWPFRFLKFNEWYANDKLAIGRRKRT